MMKLASTFRRGLPVFLFALIFVPASSHAGDLPNEANVELIRDLAYVEGPDADPVKHKLDLYLPPGRKDYPVLFFVHGGGWSHGDKKFWFDLYGRLGRSFASQGIGVAVINYRLAPKIKHPDQARDVAKAIGWVSRNIAKYGGKADQLFLAGHSAGGHLVSLVTSDKRFLQEEGVDLSTIRGVVPISAVYDVRPGVLLFDMVFGKDSRQREDASPICHIDAGLPPFLMIHGDHELPQCDGPCADRFYQKLKEHQVTARVLPIAHRDHMSIIARIAETNDPGHQAMVQFIRTQKP